MVFSNPIRKVRLIQASERVLYNFEIFFYSERENVFLLPFYLNAIIGQQSG